MRQLPASILADPARAPTQAEWDALTPAEREAVAAALPSETCSTEAMSEGDPHHEARDHAWGALKEFFGRQARGCYVGSNMAVYYPGEERIEPDVFVVLDVTPGPRLSWLVSKEGKGPDFILEVLHSGDPAKDLKHNVVKLARLGVPEYFVFDRRRQRLFGWALEGGRLEPILPQYGRFASATLGLDLALEGGLLRFYSANAPLLAPAELSRVLERTVDEVTRRYEEAERLREEEQRLREEEQQLREAAERRLAEALAELERLKGR